METYTTPEAIARWFVAETDREAGDAITNLKLQKLVYYAQAWSLALLDKPLFPHDFEAWMHGPVLPCLYQKYKAYGWGDIPNDEDDYPEFAAETLNLLHEVYRVYGSLSAKYLENLSHQEEPWKEARGDLPLELRCVTPISKDTMKNYYKALNG